MQHIKVCLILLFSITAICSRGNDYTDIIEAESIWLSELQTPLGAILLSNNNGSLWNDSTKFTVEPYFANFAMMGLLDNPTPQNLIVVKKWIEWYISHLNTSTTDYNGLPGTVYVYQVYATDQTREVAQRKYDSTDSYAATFISLLKKYIEKGGDITYVKNLEPKIKIVADVIIATQDTDGLTWAKPDYKVKYLMDNCEVFEGLTCYVWLIENILSDKSGFSFYKNRAEQCLNAIETRLWNESNQTYNWHLTGESKWLKLYPETIAQSFPIFFNIISPTSARAKMLYNSICERYPNLFDNGLWTLQAYVSTKMGDYERVNNYIKEVNSLYTINRKYPWRASESGFLLRTAYEMRKKLNLMFPAGIKSSDNSNPNINILNDGRLDQSFSLSNSLEKWIELDLQEIKNISELKIVFSSGNTNKFTLNVSNNGIDYQNITAKQKVNNKTRYVVDNYINARHVRLNFASTTEPVEIKEIEIYSNEQLMYDLVVYGGTSSGVIAATAAAKQGLSVLLIEPGSNIGGMTAGGLGFVDAGKTATIGGLTRSFFERNATYSGVTNTILFRTLPTAAENIFYQMLNEQGVKVLLNSRLKEDSTPQILNGRIKSIELENNTRISANYFIDASYEGDLMAASKVSYIIGRESRSTYNESAAGIQKLYTFSPLNPYNNDGKLLPDIVEDTYGTLGDGDNKTQAYNFRLCMTKSTTNSVPVSMPENYNPLRYNLILQVIQRASEPLTIESFVSIGYLLNGKADFNNIGQFSTDLVNGSWDYPEANYAQRDSIWINHKNYLQGLLYFLGNDPRVPQSLRDDVLSWGFAKDEFVDTDNWPHQLYIREGRRMIGEYVMKQTDAWENPKKSESVGVGSYMIDSHYVRRFVENGVLKMEGLTGHVPVRPYEISYHSLTPKKTECQNLLVPVCLSASHVIYGSLRMEPIYMILGESAGTAVAQAYKNGLQAVQDIDIQKLQATLTSNGQILSFDEGVYVKTDFEGLVIDDADAIFTGTWRASSSSLPFMEAGGYKYADNENLATATYKTTTNYAGIYNIFYMYSPYPNRATNAKITLTYPFTEFTLNMQDSLPSQHYPFIKLGTFDYKANEVIELKINNNGADGLVIADAFLITLSDTIFNGDETLILNNLWEYSASNNNMPDYVSSYANGARGMAIGQFESTPSLVVPTRNPKIAVHVLNPLDGTIRSSLKADNVSGGTLSVSDAGITVDGKILVSNLALNAGATFKVYRWDNSISAPTIAISYILPEAGRYGDEITVIGNINNGTAKVYTASSVSVGGAFKILCFSMTENSIIPGTYVFDQNPTIFSSAIKSSHYMPSLSFLPNGNVIYKGNLGNLIELSSDGALTGNSISEPIAASIGCSPQYIRESEANTYVGYYRGESGYECAEIINLYHGNWRNAYFSAKTPLLGNNSNPNRTGRLLAERDGDHTYLYVLGTNNGIAKYQMSIVKAGETATDYISDGVNNHFKINHEGDYLNVHGDQITNLGIFDITGRNVMSVQSTGKIHIGNLKGIFIVKINSHNGSEAIKLQL